MKLILLEITARDAEVAEFLLDMASEELKGRKRLRLQTGVSLKDLQQIDKIRKKLTPKTPKQP